MSYIAKRGKAAAESAMSEGGKKFDNLIKPLKSGTSYKIRLLSDEDYVEYFAASVFKIFYTTPVADGNLYQKATDALYKAANAEKDETKAEEIKQVAYQVKPKPRYLFGFINVEDGEPIVIDLSKKQAQTIIAAIEKFAKKKDSMPFEIEKTGSGQSTAVNLSPVLDDLTSKEQENFDKASELEITDDMFENCLYEKKPEEQAEDIKKFAEKNGVEDILSSIYGGKGVTELPEDDYNF